MAHDQMQHFQVRCPHCHGQNQVCVTHPAHEAMTCTGCGESFGVDSTLIQQFYDGDDNACHILEGLYQATLVKRFFARGVFLAEAERYHIDVFTKVWETKHPRPGNDPQQYDAGHHSGASFRRWLFQIADNRLRDRNRQPLLFVGLEDSDPDGDESVSPAAIQCELDFGRNPRPQDEALARERRAVVHDCHDRLPPREKLAIAVWLECEGARGIGKTLVEQLAIQFPRQGFSAATAATLLNGALDRMRECLEGKGVTVPWST